MGEVDEFEPTVDDLFERYKKYCELWKEKREPRYARFAIEIAERNDLFDQRTDGPIGRSEIDELEREVAQYHGREEE
tara:strand:+ start:147 stop:377 length:231 start_codon:yes stop_codon:yes gene_type:complete